MNKGLLESIISVIPPLNLLNKSNEIFHIFKGFKMYKFLGKLLCAALLVVIAGACGGLGKQELLVKGNKPLKDIQGDDRKKVEEYLLTYISEDFDVMSFIQLINLYHSATDLDADETRCKAQVQGFKEKIKIPRDKFRKNIKESEAKIKAHFADTNVSQLVKCADKLPEVLNYAMEKVCPRPNDETELKKIKDEVATKYSNDKQEQQNCDKIMDSVYALFMQLRKDEVKTAEGSGKGGAADAPGGMKGGAAAGMKK